MTQTYTYYDATNGSISLTCDLEDPTAMDALYSALTRATGSYAPDQWYFVAGVATARPANPASLVTSSFVADGSFHSLLTSIPVDVTATVTVAGIGDAQLNGTGAIRGIKASQSGAYTVTVDAFPYQRAVFSVTATDALAVRRTNRCADVDSQLATRLAQGYAHSDGHTYSLDEPQILRTTQYGMLSSFLWPMGGLNYKDLTYTDRNFSYGAFQTFRDAVVDKNHAIRDYALSLKATIMGSSNPEGVNITTGWP